MKWTTFYGRALLFCVMGMIALTGCNFSAPTLPTPTLAPIINAIDNPRTAAPLPPSLTPLFTGGNTAPYGVPYGVVVAVATAVPGQPVAPNTGGIIVVDPNFGQAVSGQFAAQNAATAVPTNAATAIAYATNIALGIIPTPTPRQVTVTIPVGQINNTVGSVVNNAWDFGSSTATYLWGVAGANGGFIGQLAFCVAPALFFGAWLWRRVGRFFGGRRRR